MGVAWVEGRGYLVEAALVDLAPPVGAVEGSGFDVADRGTDVDDLRGAEAAPVFLLDPEQTGRAGEGGDACNDEFGVGRGPGVALAVRR